MMTLMLMMILGDKGMAGYGTSGVYLHFFCISVYCHITLFCSLCQPVMVSCLSCKNLRISMMTPIAFLFTLGREAFHVIYSHIGVPCHGTLMM